MTLKSKSVCASLPRMTSCGILQGMATTSISLLNSPMHTCVRTNAEVEKVELSAVRKSTSTSHVPTFWIFESSESCMTDTLDPESIKAITLNPPIVIL